MLLDERWKIESDELNVTIYERYVSRKSGREYWSPHSYFSGVVNALKGLVNIKVNRTVMRDLKTGRKEIDKLHHLRCPIGARYRLGYRILSLAHHQ